MYSEDDLLPLSGLQHLVFCERQWALIHIEQTWVENRLTALGREQHERVDETGRSWEVGVRAATGLRVHSLRLGLAGRADVVEFRESELGVALPGVGGRWIPYPVEHKRGRPKPDDCDLVQLCAQAMCLEEMLGGRVERGAIFYGRPRRRLEVEFTAALRERTERLAARMHTMMRAQQTPAARYERKCDSCSLLDRCRPKSAGRGKNASLYLSRLVAREMEGGDEE